MTEEREFRPLNGFLMVVAAVLLYAAAAALFTFGLMGENWLLLVAAGVLLLPAAFVSAGFFIVQPNQARVMVLFGTYKGTVARNGFWWANALLTKQTISLRARNLISERLKVNDSIGNPIDIAAVVVWQVAHTAQAVFDVDDYEQFVVVQIEAAVRHLAGSYPYDSHDDESAAISLRDGGEVVNDVLERELTARLGRADVQVIEARLSHLAYAPEIAEAMLRRQQATAVIAARRQIVEGAVSMVEMALERLERHGTIALDEDRKAVMISNLMVVLVSEHGTTPVVNTGTLYQ